MTKELIEKLEAFLYLDNVTPQEQADSECQHAYVKCTNIEYSNQSPACSYCGNVMPQGQTSREDAIFWKNLYNLQAKTMQTQEQPSDVVDFKLQADISKARELSNAATPVRNQDEGEKIQSGEVTEQPVDCRTAFEKWNEGRGVDCEMEPDVWGKPRYKHAHVDSMWHGFECAWSIMQESVAHNPVKVSLTDCAKAIAGVSWRSKCTTHEAARAILDELIKQGINIQYD